MRCLRGQYRSYHWALLASVLALSACKLDVSDRDDFRRDVPIADAGACTSEDWAWRADYVQAELPAGLAGFQVLLNSAVAADNLNFVIAQNGETFVFEESPWALKMGSAEPAGGGCYTFSEVYAPISAEAVVESGGGGTWTFETPGDLEFTIEAKLPFVTPLPLTQTRLTAVMSSDAQNIREGLVEGVILGEIASATLLDLQSDGDPNNDTPLANFLGEPDRDIDGDAVVDDFTAIFHFESIRVGLNRP